MATKKQNAPGLLEWLGSVKCKIVKCPLCLDEHARESVAEILEAMAAHGKHGVSLREIVERINATHPNGARFTLGGIRRHCAEHETERWAKAKGRV